MNDAGRNVAVGGILFGAVAGAAIVTVVSAATLEAAAIGAVVGGIVAWRLKATGPLPSWWALPVLAFFVPVFTMAVPPGADMAMHVALARGLRMGELSPAWPGVHVAAYPRGCSAVVALLWSMGPGRAGLFASAVAYLSFWYALATLFRRMDLPAPTAIASAAVLLSRAPQAWFGWGGNPTVMSMAAAIYGAAQTSPLLAAWFFAAATAMHPMGAIAGVLVLLARWREPRFVASAAGGMVAVLALLAVFGPRLSSREVAWVREYAKTAERLSIGVLGDPANVLTIVSALYLLWKRRYRLVLGTAALLVGFVILSIPLSRLGIYPNRLSPVLLVVVAPLWSECLTRARFLIVAVVAACAWGNLRWYQESTPIATRADVANLSCVARTTPVDAVIDGAYGDATQWIPAFTGRAITRPHEHVSLFDEVDAASATLPRPTFHFTGQRLRYGAPQPPTTPGTPLCGGSLLRLP